MSCISPGKAAGIDDILPEFILHLGPAALEWVLSLLNNCMKNNTIPKMWRKAKIVATLKPAKDPSSPKSFCQIALLCVM